MADALSWEVLRESAGEVPRSVRAAPWLLAAPSLLLAGGALLDASLATLHSLAPALLGIAKGVAWAFYFRLAFRIAGGTARGGFAVIVAAMVVAFVALEYGDAGLLVPLVVWLLPLIDYAGVYGEGVDGALGGVLDTLSSSAALWLGLMFGLLVMLVMVGLVLQTPMSLYATYAAREVVWMAGFVGGLFVGPLVHLAVLYRARVFVALHGDPA